MDKKIAVLAGDGIGPEIMTQALRVLDAIATKFDHSFEYEEGVVGGAAWDEHQNHFPAPTEELCKGVDAILFGSVGGPLEEAHLDKWKNCEANSILAIRKAFGFNANFRPAKVYPQLREICPLKDSVIGDGVDLLIIRELVGDIYFGEHKQYEEDGQRKALDVAEYDEEKVRNIAHIGFQAAQKRRKRLHSVDKANVLSTSKLWREVVREVAQEYSDVDYSDILVDNCAMQIIRDPGAFDVVLTPNMFGDILSDAAAVLPGSLGLTPSASLNPQGLGLYEPSGGSAPDIAGKGVANPIAQILSAAMMLQFSFGLTEEATLIEKAVDTALEKGIRTADIAPAGSVPVGTVEFTDAVLSSLT
jgi:3-isopropylmalate dehydrogenase